MKTEKSFRVQYTYLDISGDTLDGFIDIINNHKPSEKSIKISISEKWKKIGYNDSNPESIKILNIE